MTQVKRRRAAWSIEFCEMIAREAWIADMPLKMLLTIYADLGDRSRQRLINAYNRLPV